MANAELMYVDSVKKDMQSSCVFKSTMAFKYLTFRTGLSVVTSLVIVFIIGGPLIKLFSPYLLKKLSQSSI